MSTLIATFAAVTLAGGPFTAPKSDRPTIDKAAIEAEGQRQLDYVLDVRLAEEARVEAIADRLLKANADMCPATGPRLGFGVSTTAGVKGRIRDALVRRWGDSDNLRVTSLSPEGAAKLGGLQLGDELIALDGKKVATGKKAQRKWLKQQDDLLETNPASVSLTVRRAGVDRAVAITPQIACAYGVAIDQDAPELNAYADGRNIFLTRPMLKLASTETELALVLAHELAHDARRHVQLQARNRMLGKLGGLVLDVAVAAATGYASTAMSDAGEKLGGEAYSPEFESEADYVGLYFMARAGFSIEGAEELWRKMAAENPEGIFLKSSHPPTAERYLAIAATRDEIKGRGVDYASLKPIEREKGKPEASDVQQALK